MKWFKRHRKQILVFGSLLALVLIVVGAYAVRQWMYSMPYQSFPERGSEITGPASEAWVARYGGPAKQFDEIADMTVDDTENVYVAGSITIHGRFAYTLVGNTDVDYATLKYDKDGQLLWAERYDGDGSVALAEAKAMTVDREGKVYVTGTAGTVKYDADGNLLWADKGQLARGTDVVVDDLGCIYVTGDKGITKYDCDRNLKETLSHNGSESPSQSAMYSVVDSLGNRYVTTRDRYDYFTAKYSTNGSLVWAARHDGDFSGTGWTGLMTVDASGNVYVAGNVTAGIYSSSFMDTITDNTRMCYNNDFIVIKYTQG